MVDMRAFVYIGYVNAWLIAPFFLHSLSNPSILVIFAVLYFFISDMYKPFHFALGLIGDTSQYGTNSSEETPGSGPPLPLHTRMLTQLFALPKQFWLLGILHLLFSTLHNMFGGFAADMVHDWFGADETQAGLVASLDAALPILLAPLTGLAMSYGASRPLLCLLASLSSTTCFLLFAFPPPNLSPIIPMLCLSLMSGSTPTLLKSAIPEAVPYRHISQAFAYYSMLEAVGATFGNVLFAYLRDVSQGYMSSILVLLVQSLLTGLICFVWLVSSCRKTRRDAELF